MAGDKQQRDEQRGSRAAATMRVAGIVSAGVVVSLVLAPPALALISPNHNETVLAVD